MKKLIFSYLSISLILATTVGVTYAAFVDTASILGSTFSVGSADIKLYNDVTQGSSSENLVDELAGPSFENISPNWVADYPVKVYNNSFNEIGLISSANYETANDIDDLRQIIYVEPFKWIDANDNGIVDDFELDGSYGRKTIVKWKTEGYTFDNVPAGETFGVVLRFSTDSLPESKQGSTALFDFEFSSVEL